MWCFYRYFHWSRWSSRLLFSKVPWRQSCIGIFYLEMGSHLWVWPHVLISRFSWNISSPGFDHMYSSPVFLGTLVLLGASLMACTYTTQIPLIKVARRSNWMIVSIIYYFAFSYLGPLWLRMSWRNLSITELGWYLYMQMEFLRLFWGYPQAGIFRHST